MAFLNKRQSIWVTEEVNNHIKFLRMKDPDRFKSVGAVFRIAVMQLYRKEVNDGRDKDQDMRPRDSRI